MRWRRGPLQWHSEVVSIPELAREGVVRRVDADIRHMEYNEGDEDQGPREHDEEVLLSKGAGTKLTGSGTVTTTRSTNGSTGQRTGSV